LITIRPASVVVSLVSLVFASILAAAPAPASAHAHKAGRAAEAGNDPLPSVNPPAAMAEVRISSHGSRMNGLVYLAAGPGLHPVVLFLHGFPGNEKNLDLAQAVRRAGYHAVYFNYRGTWGSGGEFSFSHALEDVAAVLAWARAPETAAKYRFDTRRFALVGHSFGGWLAFMTAGIEPPSVCVAGLAAWNVGAAAQRFPAHPDERTAALDDFRVTADPDGGPVRASAQDLLDAMIAHATVWDYLGQAPVIGNRAILLVAATHDSPDEDVPMHTRMAKALRETGAKNVTFVRYDDDHPFSSHRLALANLLTHWLRTNCAKTQVSR
jgi:pimeloyl-ACP methyl ester carboxylesterase